MRHGNGRSCGTRRELPERVRAADDVAADVVARCTPRSRAAACTWRARIDVAEARCEALDLRLDRVGRVAVPALRHVAVRPRGVLALGRARVVEEALLHEQHERPLAGAASLPRRALGLRDLGERAAEVDGPGTAQRVARPRDRRVERPVELERRRPVAKAERVPRQAREARELARRDVAEHGVGARQLVDAARRHDLAAELDEPRGERVDERLRAAARKRPAVDVRGRAERRGRSPRSPRARAAATECAAFPAKSARARSVSKSRAIARALRSPRTSDGRSRSRSHRDQRLGHARTNGSTSAR